jgi:hypothetical protein
MNAVPPKQERNQCAQIDPSGKQVFDWTLTRSSITDTVRLIANPFDVLPVIFVPGIMGSNLKAKDDNTPVWRLDTGIGGIPWGMLKKFATKGPGPRQQLLHPDRCTVDDGGALPKRGMHSKEIYRERGWGEVAEGSYQKYLLWLDEQLNPKERNPALWQDYYQAEATISAPPEPGTKPKLFPGIRMGMEGEPFGAERSPFESIMTDDLMARAKFLMPVHACGYNWLDSNSAAAERLQTRIQEVIKQYNKGQFSCEQVVLVTHSMGGLVARACAQLDSMADKIAGVVHGVMPSNGAAVAYRRCKVGMRDEDFGAGLVIGSTGQEVTAVFAQAPGALQLLPAHTYASEWLRVMGDKGETLLSLPGAGETSYAAIYKERKQWWGLIDEAWLSPKEGKAIEWSDFEISIKIAEKFHYGLTGKFHPNSYVFYGADPKQKSFEKVTWRLRPGLSPDQRSRPTAESVKGFKHDDVRGAGSTPGYVGGQTEVNPSFGYGMPFVYESSYWELHCELQDGQGDGTVPRSSGAAPLTEGGSNIQQQFQLTGFGHEPAYNNAGAQRTSLFAINKIAGKARRAT